MQKFGLEYERYLKEIVNVLESDETFKKKLESANISDIKVPLLYYTVWHPLAVVGWGNCLFCDNYMSTCILACMSIILEQLICFHATNSKLVYVTCECPLLCAIIMCLPDSVYSYISPYLVPCAHIDICLLT